MRRALPLLALALGGCATRQSAAAYDARESALSGHLFVLFLIVTGIVYAIVIAFLIAAILRRRGHARDGLGDAGESREGALRLAFYFWVGISALILAGLSLASWFTDRGLADTGPTPPLDIQVIGHQWWWEVRYGSDEASRIVRTANELHLPLGVPARIRLGSGDVIHSLWIPNLAGKEDLIPGRPTELTIQPTRAGIYRGQCAEFCGMQHAHMALDVTVESPAQFAAWRRAQLQPPPAPATPLQRAGYAYMTRGPCGTCHSISGTPASGTVAPDLSHIASRRSLGAGTLAMTHANLAAWIADPQAPKPGNNMPVLPMDAETVRAVTAYLETLR